MVRVCDFIWQRCFKVTLWCMLVAAGGCVPKSGAPEVTVYVALDREFSEPILRDFESETGIRVRAKFDTESTKTVGLTSQIMAESQRRTRCDLFWNNEILNTLRLEELGLLREIHPSQADQFPQAFRSRENRWFGFAARARVLLVNTQIVDAEAMPDSINSLLEDHWKGKIGIAKPLFGTTASHAVCLFESWGEDAASNFFDKLQANDVRVLSGNKQVAEDVAAGRLAFGLTDTDDAIIEVENGFPVKIVYPDRLPEQLGTLFIPNTIAVLRDAPHPAAAELLADYLLTAETELRLAKGKSAQIPLHALAVDAQLRVESPRTIHAMPVDFSRGARLWSAVGAFLKAKFYE